MDIDGIPKHPDLIYDIGQHTGEDTAFYLGKGFRVVAVEANPTLAEATETPLPRPFPMVG